LIYQSRNGENINGGAQIVTGLGIKIGVTGRMEWLFFGILNAEWVDFSRLNALHYQQPVKIINSRAIVFRITAGISIPIKRTVKKDNIFLSAGNQSVYI
jgi:hypothetical protein